MPQPHGGTLVDRTLSGPARRAAFENAHALPRIELSDRAVADLECIATGVYSPLEGFMTEEQYDSVLAHKRLPQGLAWTIPVALQLDEARGARVPVDADVALAHPDGTILAVMTVTSKYRPDQEKEAQRVFTTSEEKHPGVATMLGEGTVYLGGPITLVSDVPHADFAEYRKTPAELRAAFADRAFGLFRMEGGASTGAQGEPPRTSPRRYLAWSPPRTTRPNFHVPQAFGTLVQVP